MGFNPVLRFAVMSDLHYCAEHPERRRKFKRAMNLVYDYCMEEDYKSLDALYVVGDFTDRGKREEMQWLKDDCDEMLKEETMLVVTMANHELHYMPDYNVALRDFKDIFEFDYDRHEVLNGYHFISLSGIRDKGPWDDSFNDEKKAFLKSALETARNDTGNKPIFVFQHAGIPETITGGIGGHNELRPTLSDFPQVIDFSGHSHNSVNDPREINQKDFTCVGTGAIAYIASFAGWHDFHITGDKNLGCDQAQMRVVEVDGDGTVRIRGLDIITGNFFEDNFIADCHDKSKYAYTMKRALNAPVPYFKDGSQIGLEKKDGKVTVTFPAAVCDGDGVKEYCIRLTDDNGVIIKQKNIFSDYMRYHRAPIVTAELEWEHDYIPQAVVYAGGFWENISKPLMSR